MSKVVDIYNKIDEKAPFSSAMEFDNVGVLVGDKNVEVKKALIALDITSSVINEAIEKGAELIISHHPIIFNPIKRLDNSNPVYKLAQNNIAALCCHTNLDISAEIGVNRSLCDLLGLKDFQQVGECLFTANLSTAISSEELGKLLKDKLNAEVSVTAEKESIQKLAFCSGSGGDFVFGALGVADAYFTGEAKHHELLFAKENNFPMYVCGHYETEKLFGDKLKEYLEKEIKDVEFILSEKEASPQYYLR